MKVLTVKKPWAAAIMLLGKDVENRTWKTDYRGRILIHSSRAQDGGAYNGSFGDRFNNADFIRSLRHGFILGSVELFDCVPDAESEWAEKGLWHWRVKDPVVFKEPIPAAGSLGLWEYNGRLLDEQE